MLAEGVHLVDADPSHPQDARFPRLNAEVQLMLARGHQVGIRKLGDLDRVCCSEELDTIEGQV